MTPQNKRGKELEKQTTKHYKIDSQTLKIFFVCCSIAIRVQRWFVGDTFIAL